MSSTATNLLQALFFDENYYLTQKAASLNASGASDWNASSVAQAIANAGMTPWQHFVTYGAFEQNANGETGIDPSAYFDTSAYYDKVGGVAAVGDTDPVTHYAQTGYKNVDVTVTPVVNGARLTYDSRLDLNKDVYFNESEYLANKAASLNANGESGWDASSVAQAIADAGMTTWQHFVTYGAFEQNANGETGIDPSQYFDVSRYYADKVTQTGLSADQVIQAFQAANLDPISHYSLYGYLEQVFPRATSLDAVHVTQDTDIPPQSGNALIDTLLMRDDDWPYLNAIAAEDGGRNTIYYCFLTNGEGQQYDYDNYELKELNDNQKTAYEQALQAVTAITGVQFEETTAYNDADFLFLKAVITDQDLLGVTHPDEAVWGEDVIPVILNDESLVAENADPRFGQEGFETVIHEIGHAMGLEHPFFDKDNADFHPVMPQFIENTAFSIMSYERADQTKDAVSGNNVADWCVDGTYYFSPVDILALQYLYGTDGLNGSEGLVYDDTVLA